MRYESKYSAPARHKRVKTPKSLLIAMALILCSLLGCVVLAYIYTQTNSVENVFQPANVRWEVDETFNGTTKTNVSVKNTGNVESYIRAMVVITWASEDGKSVTASKPAAGTDYTITYGDSSNWVPAEDGYWYYTVPVPAGERTADLIDKCEVLNAPEGFYLSVEILASSIQATPTSVVTAQWSSGVSGVNGTTLVIKQEEGNS